MTRAMHTDEVKVILKHAQGFVSFAPRSIRKLTGMDLDRAKAHCRNMAKIGLLHPVTISGEQWYQAKDKPTVQKGRKSDPR